MMATLEWATLTVCCVALLLRVPDAVKGRNRTVFGILLLAHAVQPARRLRTLRGD